MISQGIWDQVAKTKIQSRPDYSATPAWGQAPVQDILSKINSGQYDPQHSGTNEVFSSGGYQAVPWMGGHAVYKALDPSIAGDGANQLNGTPFDIYDQQGNFLGSNKFDSISSMSAGKQFGIGAAMLAAPFALTAMGVAGAAGAGGAAAADAAAMYGVESGIGAGSAGGLGAGTGGVIDLGGGLSIGADGSILGSTMAGGGTMSNAAIDAMIAGGSVPGAVAGGGSFMDLLKSGASSLFGGGGSGAGGSMFGGSNLLGLGASALGGLAGGQGQNASTSSTRAMDPRMDALFYGDLAPRSQGLLGSQMPLAQGAGAQMMAQGGGLLGAPVAPNGVGRVGLNAPTTATNPYLSGMADDIGRRTQELLGANNLQIQGNSVMSGTLGSDRQGIAQGTAAGKAADYLQGQLAGLYGNAYNQDQSRALQQYGMDQGFYGQQRGQDLAQVGIGAGLVGQGLGTQWSPLQSTANVYQPFTGFGTTTNNQQTGGGWQGAVGGLLAGASLGKSMGWWG